MKFRFTPANVFLAVMVVFLAIMVLVRIKKSFGYKTGYTPNQMLKPHTRDDEAKKIEKNQEKKEEAENYDKKT